MASRSHRAQAQELTRYWNSFESLPAHRGEGLLRRTESAIIARTEDGLTLEDLKKAVRVFAHVREHRDQFWSYPWELPDFLSRGAGKWVRATLSPEWKEHFRPFASSKAPEWLIVKMQRAIDMARERLMGARGVTDEEFFRLVRLCCQDLNITFTQELFEEALRVEEKRAVRL